MGVERIGVIGQLVLVLVGERSPYGAESEIVAQLELTEQGHTIEQFALQIPVNHERQVAVADELHVVHHGERVGLRDVAEVGLGHDEQQQGHLVPLGGGTEVELHLSPRAEPQAIVGGGLAEVVAVLSAEQLVDTEGVADGEHGGVFVDEHAVLLGVHVFLAGSISEAQHQLGGAQLGDERRGVAHEGRGVVGRGIGDEGNGCIVTQGLKVASGLVLLGLNGCGDGEVVVGLVVELYGLTVVEHHLVDCGPVERGEHVILVGGEELVRGAHHVVSGLDGYGAAWELVVGIVLLVERGHEGSLVIVLLTAHAPCIVTLEEEVGVEVGGGLKASAESPAVDEVAGDDGVDGTDVNFRGSLFGTRLDEVLDANLEEGDGRPVPRPFLHAFDESAHAFFAPREVDFPEVLPEGFLSHGGIGVDDERHLSLEELLVDGLEGVVALAGGAYGDGFLKEVGECQLGNHVVGGECPLAVVEQGVFLLHPEVFDEVDVGALGERHVAALHVVGGVLQDVKLAAKAEVLLVVGQELEVVARVAVDLDGVDDVVAVEGDGLATDGGNKIVAQQAYLVVVDVDIGKSVAHDDVDKLAGLNDLVDTLRLLSDDDVFLGMGRAAVDVAGDRLVETDREDKLIVVDTGFDLIDEPLVLLTEIAFDIVGLDVVHGQRYLLVVVVFVVGVVGEVGALLGGDDATHELDGGILLAAITLALAFHRDFRQEIRLGHQADVEVDGGVFIDVNALVLVADGREGEFPAVVALDGEASGMVGSHRNLVTTIAEGGKGDAVAGDGIEDLSLNVLRLSAGPKEERAGNEEENNVK